MNKYSFAYDTHLLNQDLYSHDDVRKTIINFLLDNGVTSTTIIEPVETSIIFESTLNTAQWIRLIDTTLIPRLKRMMTDIFYHFISIKISNDNIYYEKEVPSPVLKRDFNRLVVAVVAERANR